MTKVSKQAESRGKSLGAGAAAAAAAGTERIVCFAPFVPP